MCDFCVVFLTVPIFYSVTGLLFTFHVSEAKLGKAGKAETILLPQLDGGALC